MQHSACRAILRWVLRWVLRYCGKKCHPGEVPIACMGCSVPYDESHRLYVWFFMRVSMLGSLWDSSVWNSLCVTLWDSSIRRAPPNVLQTFLILFNFALIMAIYSHPVSNTGACHCDTTGANRSNERWLPFDFWRSIMRIVRKVLLVSSRVNF